MSQNLWKSITVVPGNGCDPDAPVSWLKLLACDEPVERCRHSGTVGLFLIWICRLQKYGCVNICNVKTYIILIDTSLSVFLSISLYISYRDWWLMFPLSFDDVWQTHVLICSPRKILGDATGKIGTSLLYSVYFDLLCFFFARSAQGFYDIRRDASSNSLRDTSTQWVLDRQSIVLVHHWLSGRRPMG